MFPTGAGNGSRDRLLAEGGAGIDPGTETLVGAWV